MGISSVSSGIILKSANTRFFLEALSKVYLQNDLYALFDF